MNRVPTHLRTREAIEGALRARIAAVHERAFMDSHKACEEAILDEPISKWGGVDGVFELFLCQAPKVWQANISFVVDWMMEDVENRAAWLF